MRTWMIDPRCLCLKHLAGEHGEIHKFVWNLNHGTDLTGYVDGGLVEVTQLDARHAALEDEAARRGREWDSPLPDHDTAGYPTEIVDPERSRRDLLERAERCTAGDTCRDRILAREAAGVVA